MILGLITSHFLHIICIFLHHAISPKIPFAKPTGAGRAGKAYLSQTTRVKQGIC